MNKEQAKSAFESFLKIHERLWEAFNEDVEVSCCLAHVRGIAESVVGAPKKHASNGKIVVEKGVAMPPDWRGRKAEAKYPLGEMEVGDCFRFRGAVAGNVRAKAIKKFPDRRFRFFRLSEADSNGKFEWGCWRVK